MSSGSLTLIPTPLNPEHIIHPHNLFILKEIISSNGIVLIEDAKATRKRWTSWGLDREYISSLIEFNEHTQENLTSEIIAKLKTGHQAAILSDEGLPVFCDPGFNLVNRCHEEGIKVTSGVFSNSLILGLALSGFDTNSFKFAGFPPREKSERSKFMKSFTEYHGCIALMDTAYRLERVLSEISELDQNNIYCVASEINRDSELVKRGYAQDLYKAFAGSKRDFILVKKPCVRHRKKKK